MIDIAVLRAMAAAGATVDMILAAIEAAQTTQSKKLTERRAKDAERQRRKRSSVHDGHAESRGSSNDVRDPPLHILPPQENSEPKKVPRSMRGTRIPDDWSLSSEDLVFARTILPERAVNEERDKFRDYWRARAGAGGAKSDWSATWRNWIRNVRQGPHNGRSDESKSVLAAADRLIDHFGGPEAARAYVPGSSGPKPLSLDFGASPSSVRLLPKG